MIKYTLVKIDGGEEISKIKDRDISYPKWNTEKKNFKKWKDYQWAIGQYQKIKQTCKWIPWRMQKSREKKSLSKFLNLMKITNSEIQDVQQTNTHWHRQQWLPEEKKGGRRQKMIKGVKKKQTWLWVVNTKHNI